jgi:hypothetical protein
MSLTARAHGVHTAYTVMVRALFAVTCQPVAGEPTGRLKRITSLGTDDGSA